MNNVVVATRYDDEKNNDGDNENKNNASRPASQIHAHAVGGDLQERGGTERDGRGGEERRRDM